MKTGPTLHFLLLGVLYLVLANAAHAWTPGFSAASGPSVWAFPFNSSTQLPPTEYTPPLSNQTINGLAGGPEGGFVALGTTALAAYVVDSFKFSYDFGSNFILGDAVFVSPTVGQLSRGLTERSLSIDFFFARIGGWQDVVLIGVTVGLTTDTQFYLSEDSGSTWTQVSTSLYLTLTNVPGDIDYADGLVVAGPQPCYFPSHFSHGILIYPEYFIFN